MIVVLGLLKESRADLSSVSVSEPASAPTAYGCATPTFHIHSNSFIPEDDPPSYEEPPTYAESIQLKYGKFEADFI